MSKSAQWKEIVGFLRVSSVNAFLPMTCFVFRAWPRGVAPIVQDAGQTSAVIAMQSALLPLVMLSGSVDSDGKVIKTPFKRKRCQRGIGSTGHSLTSCVAQTIIRHLCPLLTSPTRCLGAAGRRENNFLGIGGYMVKAVLPVDCNLIPFSHFPYSGLLSGKMMHTDI